MAPSGRYRLKYASATGKHWLLKGEDLVAVFSDQRDAETCVAALNDRCEECGGLGFHRDRPELEPGAECVACEGTGSQWKAEQVAE
jgi:DNA-binding IclR family transcriptional regulator